MADLQRYPYLSDNKKDNVVFLYQNVLNSHSFVFIIQLSNRNTRISSFASFTKKTGKGYRCEVGEALYKWRIVLKFSIQSLKTNGGGMGWGGQSGESFMSVNQKLSSIFQDICRTNRLSLIFVFLTIQVVFRSFSKYMNQLNASTKKGEVEKKNKLNLNQKKIKFCKSIKL